MKLSFEWNDVKNVGNFKKHGVWFEEAKSIWSDARAVEFLDDRHGTNEDRYIRVGHSCRSNLILVVFCERIDQVIRIISARAVTKRERKQYEEGI